VDGTGKDDFGMQIGAHPTILASAAATPPEPCGREDVRFP
jgi:hypothetical protein